jgi:cytochrome c peroxidase
VNPGHDQFFASSHPGSTLKPTDFPITTGDIVGSQGTIDGNYLGLSGGSSDNYLVIEDHLFNVNGVNQRQVTGRNAPSAVNAIFYFRNFWDGRANNSFNGVDPFGPVNQETAVVYQLINGAPAWVKVKIPNASLASQAVGPPNNPVEMAFAGRTFSELGRKMLGLTPLALQTVDARDSQLGKYAAAPTGLKTTYADMIKAAFDPKWWNYAGPVAGGYTMMESNFSLYFGLSVMLYESTLVSDQTPFDSYMRGNNAALTASQKEGLKVYEGRGRCKGCHGGAELSAATVSQVSNDPLKGFFNTAVRPLAEDGGDILQPGQGKFKTPQLRNIELNGPYFHDGSASTLMQVVDFYNRGGDFPSDFTDNDVRALGLSDAEKAALVDFMVALTDERVRWERAPFDHPSLELPNGPYMPAVGATGRSSAPLRTFLGLDPRTR